MKIIPASLLTALALPVAAAEASPSPQDIIKNFLPDAKAAPAIAPEPVPAEPEPEPTPAPEPEPAPAPQPEPVPYTPDITPVADISPDAFPEQYQKFVTKLDEQLQRNDMNCCEAMEIILACTNDELAAEKWMAKAAEAQHPVAMHYLADLRLKRVSAKALQAPDIVKAYELARKAADAGFDPAAINVTICLRNGIGTKKDTDAADKYIFNACKKGGFIPRFKWLQFTKRLTTFEDRERPEVKAEINRGNYHVIYYLAMLAQTQQEQIEWITKAAEAGSPDAIYTQSALLSSNNPQLSYKLLMDAIKKHHAEAMFTMGAALVDVQRSNINLIKAGINPDDKAGRFLLRLASMIHSPAAHYHLGQAYYHGNLNISKNLERAYRHFEAASRDGHAPSGAAHGLMLLLGQGVTADPKQGSNLIRAAATAGYHPAIIMLAYAYYEGIGMPKDASMALSILQEAAAMGNVRAYVYMAYITEKGGVNVTADKSMADRYLRMAALDMKEKAYELYKELMAAEKWVPTP